VAKERQTICSRGVKKWGCDWLGCGAKRSSTQGRHDKRKGANSCERLEQTSAVTMLRVEALYGGTGIDWENVFTFSLILSCAPKIPSAGKSIGNLADAQETNAPNKQNCPGKGPPDWVARHDT
jgi:hypothetical protein